MLNFLKDKKAVSLKENSVNWRTNLIENDNNCVATEHDAVHILNVFSNIVTNLKISEYANYDLIANNISHPI